MMHDEYFSSLQSIFNNKYTRRLLTTKVYHTWKYYHCEFFSYMAIHTKAP